MTSLRALCITGLVGLFLLGCGGASHNQQNLTITIPQTGSQVGWVAVQDGEGPWTQIDPASAQTTLALNDAEGHYLIAWRWARGGGIYAMRTQVCRDPVIDLPGGYFRDNSDYTAARLSLLGIAPGQAMLIAFSSPDTTNLIGPLTESPRYLIGLPRFSTEAIAFTGTQETGFYRMLQAESAFRFPAGFSPESLELDARLAQPLFRRDIPVLVPPACGVDVESLLPVGDRDSAVTLRPPSIRGGTFSTLEYPWAIGPTNHYGMTLDAHSENPDRPGLSWVQHFYQPSEPPSRIEVPSPLYLDEAGLSIADLPGRGRVIRANPPMAVDLGSWSLKALQQGDQGGFERWLFFEDRLGLSPTGLSLPDLSKAPGWDPASAFRTDIGILGWLSTARSVPDLNPWAPGFRASTHERFTQFWVTPEGKILFSPVAGKTLPRPRLSSPPSSPSLR